MTGKTAALAYLEKLQEDYILNGGISPLGFSYSYVPRPKAEPAYFDKIRADLIGNNALTLKTGNWDSLLNFVESRKDDFTKHENFYSVALLAGLLGDLQRVFKFSKMPFPGNVVVGTAQFGQINAFASAPSRDSEFRVVMMDDGLFTFINIFAKIVSLLLPKRTEGNNSYSFSFEDGDIKASLASNTEAHVYFSDLVTTYIVTGHSAYAKPFSISYRDTKLAEILRETAELFIMAHEFGHIVNNHLSGSKTEERRIAKNYNVETWVIDHAKEFQADQFALMIVMRLNHVLEDMSAEIAFAGVSFFFTTIDILYKALGYSFSASHPSPAERIENLYQSLYNDTSDKALVDDIVRFSKSISRLIGRLWDMNKDGILESIEEVKRQQGLIES